MTPLLLAAALAAPPPDADRVLGAWTVMAWQDDDFEKVGLGGGGHTLTVAPDLVRVTSAGTKSWTLGTAWALDPARKWFDFPGSRMGLYDLDGDTLRLVLGKPGMKNRPTAFVSSSRDNKNGNDKYLVARRETGFAARTDAKHWGPADGWKVGPTLTPADGAGPIATARADHADFTLRLEWLGDEAATGSIALRGAAGEVWRLGLGCTKTKDLGRVRYLPGVTFGGKTHAPKFPSCAPAFYADVTQRGGKLTAWVNGENVVENAAVPGAAGGGALVLGGSGVSFRGPRVRVWEGNP